LSFLEFGWEDQSHARVKSVVEEEVEEEFLGFPPILSVVDKGWLGFFRFEELEV